MESKKCTFLKDRMKRESKESNVRSRGLGEHKLSKSKRDSKVLRSRN